jgi:predicted HicB family RNase H-like nuclease
MVAKVGKLTIRFESLKQLAQVRKAAKEARVSLNRFMVDAVMEKVSRSVQVAATPEPAQEAVA